MGRIHLFEIEDQAWCPPFLRETTTDFLLALYNVLNIYEPAYQKIHEILHTTQGDLIIDCCSGSGGPIRKLRDYLDNTDKTDVTITLTDKYPNIKSFQNLEMLYPNKVHGHTSSLDATQLPAELKGMRTFFSSFHHFSPESAVKILQDAVNNRAPIGIFESTQRHPVDFLRALVSPLLVLLLMPFSGRLTWRKFLITYVLPIAPFVFMWDYLVSNCRTYSPKELQALLDQVHSPNYKWMIGKMWSSKAKCHISYLIGHEVNVV